MTRCWLFYRSAFSRFSIIYNYDQERQGTQDCMDNIYFLKLHTYKPVPKNWKA